MHILFPSTLLGLSSQYFKWDQMGNGRPGNLACVSSRVVTRLVQEMKEMV